VSRKSKGTSTTAESVDGSDDAGSFALPLTGGESYPLDITPLPKARNFNEYPLPVVANTCAYSNTPKSPPFDADLTEMAVWAGYHDC